MNIRSISNEFLITRQMVDSPVYNQQELLRRKINDLLQNWDLFSEKLKDLEKQRILETRTDEKLRLQDLIDEARTGRDQVGQELSHLQSQLSEVNSDVKDATNQNIDQSLSKARERKKKQNNKGMLPLQWKEFSVKLIKTLDKPGKIWLFSRTGMDWRNSEEGRIYSKLTPFFNLPDDEKLRFLFLGPNSISFKLDTRYFWSPVSREQAFSFKEQVAKKEEERKTRAIEFYNDVSHSVSLKVIDILIPLSMWIIWPQGKQQPKLFVEIPTNRDQYERNLYLPINASSSDTKQQQLCEQYFTLFDRLWSEARIWNP